MVGDLMPLETGLADHRRRYRALFELFADAKERRVDSGFSQQTQGPRHRHLVEAVEVVAIPVEAPEPQQRVGGVHVDVNRCELRGHAVLTRRRRPPWGRR